MSTVSGWGRCLVLLGAGQFLVSVALLLIASASRQRPPFWLGIVDVTLVLALVGTAALLRKATGGKTGIHALQWGYHVATNLPVILLLLLWVLRDRLLFNTLLPGLAWRVWLLLYTFPAALTAWSRAATAAGAQHTGSVGVTSTNADTA